MDDVDGLLRRISERLAQPSSRRGLMAGLGKLAMGAAVAVAAQSLFSHVADAAAGLHCCSGTACPDYACPAGTHAGYTWACSDYMCHDCYSDTLMNKNNKPKYVCTYSVARTPPPPPKPKPKPKKKTTTTVRQPAHHTNRRSAHHTSIRGRLMMH